MSESVWRFADKVAQHLSGQMSTASAELEVLIEDERQQPITFNHYYTDNVQKARQSDSQDLISTVIQDAANNDYGGALHTSNNGIDMQRLIKALQRRVIVDIDKQACAEARAGLDAYYKVARKSFVDNVYKQVIERNLLRSLPTLFLSEIVASYSEADLTRIAVESPQTLAKQKHL
ncbi:hypothetical protein LTR87_017283 [Friedmanniomyces endolithicus]|nr:hypothetical protein LTR87_017283 [Friedmanniomyces endolithicus]